MGKTLVLSANQPVNREINVWFFNTYLCDIVIDWCIIVNFKGPN